MQNNQSAERTSFGYGQRVGSIDITREQSANRSQIGKSIAMQQGTPNALPILSAVVTPLAVTANGSMQVSIGGDGQTAFIDGFECDACPLQNYNVPAASSTNRTDLIVVQYAQVDLSTETDEIEDGAGNQASGTAELIGDGAAYEYIQGDASGNAPAAPTGWNAFATIAVAANATGIAQANITYLFKTMNPQGPIGPEGNVGPTGPSPNPRGQWTQATTYEPLDLITYAGGSWILPLGAVPQTGTPPAAPLWTQVAAAGIQGQQGNPGSNGRDGMDGAAGQNGAAGTTGPTPWTATTGPAVIPAVGQSMSVAVARPDAFPTRTLCVVSDGTNAIYGYISQPGSPLGIFVIAILSGGVGATMQSGATITFSGIPGPAGAAGNAGQQGSQGIQGPQGQPGTPAPTYNGPAGSSTSYIFAAGIVLLTKRVNYGTNETALAANSDDAYNGPSGYLGATMAIGAFDGAQTIELQFRISVKRGAGAQNVGGQVLTNAQFKVFVDGAQAYSNAGTDLQQAWSAGLPDDGATHTVILHLNATSRIYADFGRFVPASQSGGVDPNRFTYVGD